MDQRPDDWELLQAYLGPARSPEAFRSLVDRYIALVFSTARRRTRDFHGAQDVTQAVFVILAKKASTIRRGVPLSLWLHNVTRYAAANAMKMDRTRQFHERKAAEMKPVSTSSNSVDQVSLEDEEMSSSLELAIDHLKERDRAAIILRFFQGRSFAELAGELGGSPHAMEVRVSRAVEKLRQHLASQGAALHSAALTAVLAAQTADLAPAAMSRSVCQAALGQGVSASASSIAASAMKSMSGVQAKAMVAIACALVAILIMGGVVIHGIFGIGHGRPAPIVLAAGPVILPSPPPDTTALPATQPAPADIDVPALVRKIRHDEAWIDNVKSFDIRFDEKWIRTNEGIDEQVARLARQFPDQQIDETTFPELKAETDETMELAFDANRLFSSRNQPDGAMLEDKMFWDGQNSMRHTKYLKNQQESVGFDKSLNQTIPLFTSDIPWLRAGAHAFWWIKVQSAAMNDAGVGKPEDFYLAGQKNFRGQDCWILARDVGVWCNWYVGVSDHRLHGLETLTITSDGRAKYAVAAVSQINKDFGTSFQSQKEVDAWIKTIPAPQSQTATMDYRKQMRPWLIPAVTQWYENYQQVEPDHWIPMHMGYDIWTRPDTPLAVAETRDMKVVSVTIDQPLADELFHMGIPEGVQVFDQSHDPPLIYKYKKNTSEAEWEQVIADARQRKEDALARQKAMDNAVGKPAPAFPVGQWLNSKALNWDDLNGKIVILDFWAEWCAPCRNDLPLAVDIDKNRKDKGIVVIGVHPPGSEIASIQKVMDEFKMNYPICIDSTPPKGALSWGLLYSQYGVTAIPDSFLVDGNGIVVAHGPLSKMLAQATKMSAK